MKVNAQLDFIGEPAAQPIPPFVDIPNTRSSVAEEKAVLAFALVRILNQVPSRVLCGSIQIGRAWLVVKNKTISTLKNKHASVSDLRAALSAMNRFHCPEQELG